MGILKTPVTTCRHIQSNNRSCCCSTNKHLRSKVEVNMLIAKVFIVCLILYCCATKEYSIIPSEDTQCCNLSYTLESIALGNSSDTTIELILHPGKHLLLSKLEIVDKDSLSLSSPTDTEQTNIICNNNGGILLVNVNHAEISNTDFLGCAYITVTNVTTFIVKNCAFVDYLKREVNGFFNLKNTNATIKICSFQEVSTSDIAMLTFDNSNITFEQTDFVSNRGRIISCTARNKTTINITNCTFSNNSVEATTYNYTSSALIHLINSNLTMKGTTIEKIKEK